ncbi:MAG: CDP-diacylglycerol--glycerol-3-phosphate 3-phosphatidyltransferase [Clostridia bacterium]|jgi:CDP-diacylglycerol--glycerol-3-phosphate 3-phosphatidyltransferase
MNLANKITMFRILLIPIYMFFLLSNVQLGNYVAAIIFIIAASTDSLDGYIARSRKQVTNLGKFIDPIADKLLVAAALVSLVELNKLSAVIAMIIISREFIVTGFRVVAASEGIVLAANWLGKLKTIIQMIAIVAITIDNFPFSYINFPFDKISLYIAVLFTLWSGFDYIIKNKAVLHFPVDKNG